MSNVPTRPMHGDRPPAERTPHLALEVCADAAASLVAVALATVLCQKLSQATWAMPPRAPVLFVWVAVMVGLGCAGLYSRSGGGSGYGVRVAKGCAAVAGVLSAIEALAGDRFRTWLPPTTVLVSVCAAAVALVAWRRAAAAVWSRARRKEDRVLVLGAGVLAHDVVSRLQRTAGTTFLGLIDDQPVGLVEDEPADGSPVLGRVAELPDLCRRLGVTRVVVAIAHPRVEQLVPVLRSLPADVTVDLVPIWFELTGWGSRVVDFDGLSLLSLAPKCAASRRDQVKRAFDVVAASVMLLLLLPVLGLCAAAVACTSGRPVFFRQERVGRNRQLFRIVKFRTLKPAVEVPDDDAGPTAPKLHSELVAGRVTPVGNLLRRTSLDELPQLFNVVAGHMSMVGPRPFVSEDCEALGTEADRRFDVRPGLTGLWQVCGQHSLRLEELVRLDRYYVETWSLRNDIRIMVKTLSRLRRGGGDGVAKSVHAPVPTTYEAPSPALEPSAS